LATRTEQIGGRVLRRLRFAERLHFRSRVDAGDLLSPGRQWLKFRLEDGREGWIRDVDIAPIDP
jgi:hypothetical protein